MKKIFLLIMTSLILTGCSINTSNKNEYNLLGYGKYRIPNNYIVRRDHSSSKKYFFVNKKDYRNNKPNNISVEGGTNRYSKENHMQFKQAIMTQLLMQAKIYNSNVLGSGITSKKGNIVYRFEMKTSFSTTVQYYVVGDYKYLLVHETIFDENVKDVENAAKYIVDSFEWE